MTQDTTTGGQRRRSAAENRERARQAYQLKISGATFASIAQALDYNDAAAALRAYRGYLRANTDPDTIEFHRELELARLEDLRTAIYAQAVGDPGDQRTGRQAVQPDLAAIAQLLSIHDRKVRLLGLNREPTVDPEEELRRYAREHDLDEELVLREAAGIISANQRRWRS